MKIEKIKIKNFKCYADTFEASFNSGVNIIVGSNESGKSTILEAIHLALTGMLNGRYLKNELSSYLFNFSIEQKYLESLGTENPLPPPNILIEVYFSGDEEYLGEFVGDGNSERRKACGVSYRIEFDQENHGSEYAELVKAGEIQTIPIEYYKAKLVSFSRNVVTARKVPIKSA